MALAFIRSDGRLCSARAHCLMAEPYTRDTHFVKPLFTVASPLPRSGAETTKRRGPATTTAADRDMADRGTDVAHQPTLFSLPVRLA
jgi:hypothetical protein